MSFSITTLRGFMGKISQSSSGFNYYSFCASPDSIPGLTVVSSNHGVLFNNFTDFSGTLTSDSITFTIGPALSQFLTDNIHARLRYTYNRQCSDFPINSYDLPITTLTDGLILNLTQYAGCSTNSNTTNYTVTVTLDTDDGSYLYNDICCTPYSLRCGPTLLSTFSFQINISA